MNQLEKNTVSAYAQLPESQFCYALSSAGTGLRILFLGNSITLHGVAPQIGWNRLCGMAASEVEKDYVHLCRTEILKDHPDAAFTIAQVAEWERQCFEGERVLPLFQAARDFHADVIIARFIENCPWKDFDHAAFREQCRKLLAYFDPEGDARFVITDGFWHHPGDEDLKALAEELGVPFVTLGDLGERDDMKAVGEYEHGGVAQHPGDAGMAAIAQRILDALHENAIL